MKKHILRRLLTAACLTLLPVLPAILPTDAPSVQTDGPAAEAVTEAETAELSTSPPEEVENAPFRARASYRILETATGTVREVPVRDYLIGAVGAEMPATFEEEALKAQVVAAHTYAERQAMTGAAHADLQGADLTDDPARSQAYLPESELRVRWGDRADEYDARLSTAVDEVVEMMLVYEDEPIIAAFHAMSGGRTESAAHVWGTDVPYLQSVESAQDCEAPQFEDSVALPAEDVLALLRGAREGVTVEGDAAEWFGAAECSAAGTVLQVRFGDTVFTGQELRRLLGLRSAIFTIAYEDGTFRFTTHGYGHAVGMSQYGANAMAQDGATYEEILAYYYPGAVLRQADLSDEVSTNSQNG